MQKLVFILSRSRILLRQAFSSHKFVPSLSFTLDQVLISLHLTALGVSLLVLFLPFQKVCFPFAQLLFFPVDLCKTTNNCMTKQILGYLEFSAKEIGPLLLNLASGKFLEHGQKAAPTSNSIGMFSNPVVNIAPKALELGLHGLQSFLHCLPSSHQDELVSLVYSILWLMQYNVPNPSTFHPDPTCSGSPQHQASPWYQILFCIRYFCIVVIEYHRPRQLTQRRVYGLWFQKVRVYHYQRGKTWQWAGWRAKSVYLELQAESIRQLPSLQTLKPTFSEILFLQEHTSYTFPKNITNWRPSIQTPNIGGAISIKLQHI